MRRLAAALARFLHAIAAPFIWAWHQLERLLRGLFSRPWAAFRRLVRAIADAVERLVDRILDLWDRVWRSGRTTERVREHRVGANGAPLLAAISLALFWYFVPIPRWLGYGPLRFVLVGFLLWVAFLLLWLSRCRVDRRGRVARFVQGIHRSTGLRRLDQLGLALSLLLLYLVFGQVQLLPLAFACFVAFVSLLVVEHRPRPGFVGVVTPTFPEPPSGPGDGAADHVPRDQVDGFEEHRLHWQVLAHGQQLDHEAIVHVDPTELSAARERNPGRGASPEDLVDWVTTGSGQEVVELARQIHDQCFAGGYSLYATVSCFVAACQSIPYVSDMESTGREEYWRYPIETIADHAGDCEDSAVLLAALLRRAGFRSLLVVFPKHAAVAVEVPHDTPGAYFEHEGVRYYYCETTDEGWVVGDVPAGFADLPEDVITIVPVPEWEAP